jgi:soluble cytochrome b562
MELFQLIGKIAINSQDAIKDIEGTTEKASGLGTKMKAGIVTAAKWGTAIAAGAAAAGAGVMKLATNSAAAADEVDKMSQKIGLSKEGYQEWSYVLGQNGMDISSLQMGMKTLVTQMDGVISGSATSIEMFDKLGLSVTDANGALKDQETMMNEVMIALADMPNGTEKARLATELFGRSGAELMPMLNQGSEAMLELTQRSHDLGLIMSDEAVNAGVVLGDTMDDVKQSLGMVATQLGVQLMPLVQQVLNWVIKNMPTIKKTVSDVMTTVGTLIRAITPIVQEVFAMIGVLWNTALKPILDGIITFLSGVFTGNWKQAFEGLGSIVKGIMNGIIETIETTVNGAIRALNRMIEGINKASAAARGLLGIPSIPTIGLLNLPRLEEGGILEKGQMGFLEGNGAEAVVPLDQNRAWISALAKDMEGAGIGGNRQQTQRIIDLLEALIEMLPESLKDAFASMKFDVNNREFARLVKAVG